MAIRASGRKSLATTSPAAAPAAAPAAPAGTSPERAAGGGADADDDEFEFEAEEEGAGLRIEAATPGMPASLCLRVPEAVAGQRLDKVLAAAFADLSRSRIQALMDEGRVAVDGRPTATASLRVRADQLVEVVVPAAVPALPEAEAIPLDIIYEDGDILVLDKPAGLVVHPAAGNPSGTLVNALLHHCGAELSGIGGVRRPGIVHRLDKDTSGLMVVAKTDRAHAGLTAQFADRSLSRTYHAIVTGVPAPASGTVDAPIARSPSDRKKMAVISSGRPAITRYRVLRQFAPGTAPAASLVECTLLTGRTHQIRVHLTHIGHPLIGDPTYGRAGKLPGLRFKPLSDQVRQAAAALNRQALHAVALSLTHPATGARMSFTSKLPRDIQALLDSLECV